MEIQGVELGQEFEIESPSSTEERGLTRTCGESPCGFFDAQTISEDTEDRSMSMKKLSWAILLCLVSMTVELVGGIEAHSMAVLTDVAHLITDVAGFAISIFSLWASGWVASPRRSYGYFRLEILLNIASILGIWRLTVWIVYEGIKRLSEEKREIKGSIMFGVASFGLVVNFATALMFGKAERNDNINIQGAYLHAIGDSIQNVGVMISAGFIWWNPGLGITDFICTMIFSLIVVGRTFPTILKLFAILMELAPREIDCTRLTQGLCDMDEVISVHELHVWTITLGKVCLTCHVRVNPDADTDATLDKVIEYIKREYGISHVTVQLERERNP